VKQQKRFIDSSGWRLYQDGKLATSKKGEKKREGRGGPDGRIAKHEGIQRHPISSSTRSVASHAVCQEKKGKGEGKKEKRGGKRLAHSKRARPSSQ